VFSCSPARAPLLRLGGQSLVPAGPGERPGTSSLPRSELLCDGESRLAREKSGNRERAATFRYLGRGVERRAGRPTRDASHARILLEFAEWQADGFLSAK
jgi:hypothetical protein